MHGLRVCLSVRIFPGATALLGPNIGVTGAGNGIRRVRVLFDNSVVIRVASKTHSRVGDGTGVSLKRTLHEP